MIVENVIQIKNGIINCRCDCQNLIKHNVCEKNYIWNPSTCACRSDKYLKSINGDSVVTCGEIVDVIAKSYDKPTNTNEERWPVNRTFLYFTCLFINYHISIDNRQYLLLLLPYKTMIKTKTNNTILSQQ